MDEHTVTVDLAVDIYEYAKGQSTFEDTLNTVLRRLLGLAEVHDGSDEHADEAHLEVAPTATVAEPHAPRAAATRGGGGRRRGGKVKRTRAAAGTLLPESDYHGPILACLRDRGGRAPKGEVIEEVGRLLADRLTDADRQPLDSGGIRWQSRTQFARLRLVDRGLMDREAPRGTWAITEEGIKALEEGTV